MTRGRTCVVGPCGSQTTRPVEVVIVRLIPATTQSILKATTLQQKDMLQDYNNKLGSWKVTNRKKSHVYNVSGSLCKKQDEVAESQLSETKVDSAE